MNPASLDIRDVLDSAGVLTDWSAYVGLEPAEGSQTVTLYDSGDWRAPEPNVALEYPSVQARIRAGNYATGYAQALAVRNAIHALPAQTVNGTRYVGVWGISGPLFLGYDESDRARFTVNAQLTRATEGLSAADWEAHVYGQKILHCQVFG